MSEVRSQAPSQLLSLTQAHSPGPDSSLKLRWEHQEIRFSEEESKCTSQNDSHWVSKLKTSSIHNREAAYLFSHKTGLLNNLQKFHFTSYFPTYGASGPPLLCQWSPNRNILPSRSSIIVLDFHSSKCFIHCLQSFHNLMLLFPGQIYITFQLQPVGALKGIMPFFPLLR